MPGINGDAQRIEQIVWILFLKIYDAKEQSGNWKTMNITQFAEFLRWQNWAER